MKAFVSVTGNFFSHAVSKKITEWHNDWKNAEFEDKTSLVSVLLILPYMLMPFNAMWFTNSLIIFGLCLFLAPIMMKLIQWKHPSVLFLRCSIIAGLFWLALFYAMLKYS